MKRYFALILISLVWLFTLAASYKSKPKVYIKKVENSGYQLMVNHKPYLVKGVCYNPIPIGESHNYDWWSDANKPWINDGRLMREMGINTVRIYQPGENPETVRMVIRDLYELYGIRTILGHWLGFWDYPNPFYGDKDFQERVKKEVAQMVSLYKDEAGLLMWILGNENNYSCFGNVNPWTTPEVEKEEDPRKQNMMRAKIYYSFVNEVARQVHKIDPRHLVALGNGELRGLEFAKDVCPDIDLLACILYRGKTFGNLFNSVRLIFDRPLLLSEFGADAYDAHLDKEDEDVQAFFLEAQWRQIYDNLAGAGKGADNCIGGIMFEWTDEWWKHNEYETALWGVHDTGAGWFQGSYYFDNQAKSQKNMNEEWFGIVALSPEFEGGINKRIPRKAYYVIRELWKEAKSK